MQRFVCVFVLLFSLFLFEENVAFVFDKISPLLKNLVFQPEIIKKQSESIKRNIDLEKPLNIWIFFDSKFPPHSQQIRKRETLVNNILSQLPDNAKRRRAKMNPEIVDETDLPIPSEYINEVLKIGVIHRTTSNWLNAISCTLTKPFKQLEAISRLPFVTYVDIVHSFQRTVDSNNNDIEIPGSSLIISLFHFTK
jgi:hypothetical protein